MSDHVGGSVWLVGAGGMAVEYAKVLTALGLVPVVVGRGQDSATAFQQKTGIGVVGGGLEAFLQTRPEPPSAVIIAVNVVELARTAALVSGYGQPKILLEKPGALTMADIALLRACEGTEKLFIAYNRRFFASTQAVRAMLEEDGGPVSCTFEFTEWTHQFAPLIEKKNPLEMEHWMIANSSHVVDLAFHLAGEPEVLHATVKGALPWHPSGSAFCGSGLTTRGVTFAYQANWKAPGRWWVEVMSEKRRFRMCPMESVQVQPKGQVTWTEVPLEATKDKEFKPGLYDMVAAFLSDAPPPTLCRFDEQMRMLACYRTMAGYSY